MSHTNRITSALFTALPSIYFLYQAIFGIRSYEYFWKTYMVVASVLLGASLFFGFVLPPIFRLFHISAPWAPIVVGGLLAWLISMFVLILLNATTMCVGQDNGDGNNDLGMCMTYTFMVAVVFGSVYGFLLVLSGVAGHWIIKAQRKAGI